MHLKTPPKASVIIAAYNCKDSLRLCLDALCTQNTTHSFEVIVVDDASTQPLDVLRPHYAEKLSLTVLRLPQNSGPAAARNAGVTAAAGEIILFTDADCQPHELWLEKMLAPFADTNITGAKGVYASRQSDLWARLAQLEFEERYEELASHSEIDFIDTHSAAYRKNAIQTAGGFNVGLRQNEDVDLAFRIKQAGARFVFIPDALVFHTHREGWQAYAKLKFWRGFWRMQVYRQHPQKAIGDTYTPMSLKLQLLLLVGLPLFLASKTLRFIWKTAWLASCIPLARIAMPERYVLSLMTPIFCIVRGVALLSGMCAGLVNLLRAGRY